MIIYPTKAEALHEALFHFWLISSVGGEGERGVQDRAEVGRGRERANYKGFPCDN